MRIRVLPTAVFLLAALFAAAPAAAVREITALALEEGRSLDNRIAFPVFETPAEAVAVEKIASGLKPDHRVIRRLTARMPEYTLAPGIDPAALLTLALQTEGTAMGLRVAATPGDSGWTVGGTLDDLYLETRPVIFGPILFYGHLEVTLTARQGGGEPRTLHYCLHNLSARYNAGMGVQDEAREALAQLLVESAQEILARLNRDLWKAPAHVSIPARLAAIGPISGHEAELRAVGLSGAPAAVPDLLARLAREPDESARVNLIDALASLGAAEAVQPLAARYDGEDEDCRYFILKAWDYIGGPEAAALIAKKGPRDKDVAARSLGERLARPPGSAGSV